MWHTLRSCDAYAMVYSLGLKCYSVAVSLAANAAASSALIQAHSSAIWSAKDEPAAVMCIAQCMDECALPYRASVGVESSLSELTCGCHCEDIGLGCQL